jgi:hypothetical protein
LLVGDAAGALKAFETGLRLDSRLPARYFQACAYLESGQLDRALQLLRTIRSGDPQYEASQRLLSELTARNIR